MKSGDTLLVKDVSCPACGVVHLAKRNDAKCRSCIKARCARKAAQYRMNNPEAAKGALSEWRLKNKERMAFHVRSFRESNMAHRAAVQNLRRADQMQRTPSWANADHMAGMYELCAVFRRVGLDLHVDHIVPLKGELVSGLHVESNLQLLHKLDNLSKKNRFSEITA